MIILANSNIYGASALSVAELFAEYVEGGGDRVALAVSSRPLGNDARTALESSLARFGYGAHACSYAAIEPNDDAVPLDPNALFALVEGIDPLFLVCTDHAAAFAIAKAYRTGFEPDQPTRIFGRTSVVFENLESLLETPEGKQRAWHLLKAIPKRS